MVEPARHVTVSVAIRRADDERILVLPDGSLPSFEMATATGWPVVELVDEAMRSAGLPVTTLRAAWVSPALDRRLYEAVLLDDGADHGRWTERDALASVLDRRSTHASLLAAIDAGALRPSDGTRQPWYAPGWLASMAAWVEERLADAGLRRTGEIRQVRSWGRSALLRVETDRGRVWAKEVPTAFAHEIGVTGLLADVDPGLVPPLIAAEPATGRLLMAHVEGPILGDVTDRAAWTATMARLGETQHVLAAERDRLLVAGVVSAPVSTLGMAIPGLLADRDLLRVGLAGGVTEGDWVALTDRTRDLVDACRVLADTGLPDSLDHGDLSASQVIVGEMGPVILDWSDATITHPFLALAAFGSDEAGTDAYLAAWTGSVNPETADAAVVAARLVEPLHLARSYRDRVLPGLDQPWEMDRVVPAQMTRLLGVLRAAEQRVAR